MFYHWVIIFLDEVLRVEQVHLAIYLIYQHGPS